MTDANGPSPRRVSFDLRENFAETNSQTARRKSASHPILVKKPDGGFGWIVVLGSFIIHLIIDGRLYCMGTLLPVLTRKFHQSMDVSSLVMSVFTSAVLASGPICSAIDTSCGHSWTAFWGSVIATAGTVGAIYAYELWQVILSFGLITGLGLGMTYFAAVVAVLDWFEEKKTLAMGITVCGTGIGTFVLNAGFAKAVKVLRWKGLMKVLSGIAAVGILIAPLFISPKTYKNQGKSMDPSEKDNSCEVVKHVRCGFQKLKFRCQKVTTVKCSCSMKSLKKHLHRNWMLIISVLRTPAFMIYMVTDLLISVGLFIPYDFLVTRVAVEANDTISEETAAWLPSIFGVATLVGQLSTGILSVSSIQNWVDPVLVLCSVLFINGITACLSKFCSTFAHYSVYSVVIGTVDGVIHTLTPIVCYTLAGEELFISGWGIQMFMQGVGCLVGPVIAGAFIDFFEGSYWETFMIFGCIMILSGMILLTVPLRNYLLKIKRRSQDTIITKNETVIGMHHLSVPHAIDHDDDRLRELWMSSRRISPRLSLNIDPSELESKFKRHHSHHN